MKCMVAIVAEVTQSVEGRWQNESTSKTKRLDWTTRLDDSYENTRAGMREGGRKQLKIRVLPSHPSPTHIKPSTTRCRAQSGIQETPQSEAAQSPMGDPKQTEQDQSPQSPWSPPRLINHQNTSSERSSLPTSKVEAMETNKYMHPASIRFAYQQSSPGAVPADLTGSTGIQ